MKLYAEGPKKCSIAIVGEAPGRSEIMTGRPFVGTDGSKLSELLHANRIARGECYITNVIKEYVEPDTIDLWIRTDSKGKVFMSDKFQEYVKQLHEELATIETNLIMPLGNPALYACTGKFIRRWIWR